MKNEASPTPWSIMRFSFEDEPDRIIDANGDEVAIELLEADAALIVAAVNERDRLRDIVRRLADLSESLLANYEYRYREDPNSMAFVGNARDFIREARAAIGEGGK